MKRWVLSGLGLGDGMGGVCCSIWEVGELVDKYLTVLKHHSLFL